MKTSKSKAKFITPPNRLKARVGSGGIDEKKIEAAQTAIEKADIDFLPMAQKFLEQWIEATNEISSSPDKFQESIERLIYPVMQIKANGGMFRYNLLSNVADIALQFLEEIETFDADVLKVVRAHENAVRVILANKMTGDGGRQGQELINELDKACQRYFKKLESKKK